MMVMMESKIALIVGGSTGIGFATARQLIAAGAGVCITGRKDGVLNDAVGELAGLAGEASVLGFQGAAEDERHQRDAVTAVLERWGRLDALVVNAGVSPYYGPIADASREQIRRALEVNVVAPWMWALTVWREWMSENGGSIVNVGSVGGAHPLVGSGVYNVSKSALHHLTRQLALEFAPGVRVNAVAPATIRTRFSKAKYDGREGELGAKYPLARIGEPEDVARAIVAFCDGSTAWVTGQILMIDGGGSLLQGV
jgi:3-oxoacyl-[acyl-carrier protein] reductase